MRRRHLMFCAASAWAPQCYGLSSKRGSGFPCLLCSLFHLSTGWDWEGPSPAGFAQVLLTLTSAHRSGPGCPCQAAVLSHATGWAPRAVGQVPGTSLLCKGMGITSLGWDSHDKEAVVFSSFCSLYHEWLSSLPVQHCHGNSVANECRKVKSTQNTQRLPC